MNNDPPSFPSEIPHDVSTLETLEETEAVGDDDGQVRQKQRRQAQKKRLVLLNHLLRSIDIVIYCELSTVFYMDCAFLPFILRSLTQFYFLTPKPAYIPPIPKPAPYTTAIFGVNILCLILHVCLARPQASEAMRGYLHGGLIIDFVGQKGPTSKLRLFLLDLLVLFLQLVMFAAHTERQALFKSGHSSGGSMTIDNNDPLLSTPTVQDHDSEERGVRRSASFNRAEGDIELQRLRGSEEQDQPDAVNTTAAEGHPLNVISSGDYLLANLHLINTIRDHSAAVSTWRARRRGREESSGDSGGSSNRAGRRTELGIV